MNITLVSALLIPWVFWGVLMGLLFAAGRSWINMLLIPVGLSVVLLLTADITSDRSVFWASLVLHGVLLIIFLWSYLSFMIGERKNKR